MLSALGGLLVGVVAATIGWILFTDYRGAATWHVSRSIGLHPGDPITRDKDRSDFERQARVEHRIGAVFLAVGVIVTVLAALGAVASLV